MMYQPNTSNRLNGITPVEGGQIKLKVNAGEFTPKLRFGGIGKVHQVIEVILGGKQTFVQGGNNRLSNVHNR